MHAHTHVHVRTKRDRQKFLGEAGPWLARHTLIEQRREIIVVVVTVPQATVPSVAPTLFQITQCQCSSEGATTLSETQYYTVYTVTTWRTSQTLSPLLTQRKQTPQAYRTHRVRIHHIQPPMRQETTARSALGLNPTLYNKLISQGTLLNGGHAVRRLTFNSGRHIHPSRNVNFMTEMWGIGRCKEK